MRHTILGVLLAGLVFLAAFIVQYLLDAAPKLAWRILFVVVLAISIGWVLLSDPVYRTVTTPRDHPLLSASIIMLAAAALVGGTWWLVIQGPSLKMLAVSATTTAAQFAPGTITGGISWSPKYAPLSVNIANPTASQVYTNVDLVLIPDQPIAKIGTDTNVPDVRTEPAIWVKHTMEVYRESTGHRFTLPMRLLATDGGYRLRCPRLGPKERIDVVMALAQIDITKAEKHENTPGWSFKYTTKSNADGEIANHFFVRADATPQDDLALGSPILPTSLRLKGSYFVETEQVHVSRVMPVPDVGANALAKILAQPSPTPRSPTPDRGASPP